MNFICGSHTYNQKKPCKNCKRFLLWGMSTGYCFKHKTDMQCSNHCKYYKRESNIWNKNGICKLNENELYM